MPRNQLVGGGGHESEHLELDRLAVPFQGNPISPPNAGKGEERSGITAIECEPMPDRRTLVFWLAKR
jgi:hypothetical protein